jgi:S1-C subfamily serine protease
VRRLISVGALALLGLLAGCGDDESEPVDEAATPTAPPAAEQVVVQASGRDFNPVGIYERAAPGVVTVVSVFGDQLDILGQGGAGQGSGFVISDDGEIITNAHVVAIGGRNNGGGRPRPAREVYVEFADRNRYRAEVVGLDPSADVALLKVDAPDDQLNPLQLSDRNSFAVGEPVIAIGSPFGERQSLSVGVVSATDRAIESLTQFRIDDAIQTDAAINPGNSGGPLIDSKGEVIGINQQIETASGTDSGVGFAVPVSAVSYSVDQLREDGDVDYGYIGVSTQALWPQLAEELDLDTDTGALIGEVVDGSPADEAGLEGGDREMRFQGTPVTVGGDVIVAVNDNQLVAESDLAELIGRRRPGDTIEIEFLRDGERRQVDLELDPRPTRVPQ